MHREYRPDEMHHHHDDPFAVVEHGHEHRETGLYLFTAFLGLLLGIDLILNGLGLSASWRLPLGLTPTLLAALLGAVYIVYGALQALLQRRIGADFALAQACIAALVLGEPFVAAEVVFIALAGEVLEAVTFERTRRALGRLVDETPRTARVRREGLEVEIPARDVALGDLVIVRPGERIPVDGTVLVGRSTVDQSALTGESLPVDAGPDDPVYTGTLNQFGLIEVRAEKVGRETTFGQVVRMVTDARLRKSNLERVADRLARYFLPAVELAAALTLLAGYLRGWPDVWSRVVAVLVVACPCALVLATPAAMLASMAWLARHGILIKGGYALERLAACDTFAFDKTGTLTQGKPQVAGLVTVPEHDEADVLRAAASAENASHHPLAVAVVEEARRRGLDLFAARSATTLPGAGVQATVDLPNGTSAQVLVGNRRLLDEQGVTVDEAALALVKGRDEGGETPLLVAIDGRISGVIGLRDAVRAEAHDVIHDLKHLKIGQIALLTGDREPVARRVARKVHIKTVESERLPADKARWIREQQEAGRTVAMVGDGINDAPALAQADAGIALGGIGADLAAEAGDLILMGEPLRKLPELVEISRATVRIIRQNIIGFAFAFNALAVILTSLGILGPVAAAIMHQLGSLLVLLNSMRLLAFGGWSELPPFRLLSALGRRIHRLDESIELEPVWRWGLARRRLILGAGASLGLLAYALSGLTVIGPGEVGLVQRFGASQALLPPGLHLRFPRPIERVRRTEPERVRSVSLGFRRGESLSDEPVRWEAQHGRSFDSGKDSEAEADALLLTGDGQFLELSASLQYSLDTSRPELLPRYLLGIESAETALRVMSEAVVRRVVGRRSLLDVLTSSRAEAEGAATTQLREKVEALGIGVRVHSIAFQDVHPPLAVLDAYRDVSRAEGDRQRRLNEAATYREEKLTDARARARAIANASAADRERILQQARSEAHSFSDRLEARSSAPEVTDLRLFWEAVAKVLAGRPKLILDASTARPSRLVLSGRSLERALPLIGPERERQPSQGPAKLPGTGETSKGGQAR
jgi:Cu+-exporting ATPase